MAEPSPMKLPDGWHSVTPRIVTEEVTGLVEFLRRAFDATGDVHPDRPAVMRIGGSNVMISGVGPRPAMPSCTSTWTTPTRRMGEPSRRVLARSSSPSTRHTATDGRWSKIDGATCGRWRPSRGDPEAGVVNRSHSPLYRYASCFHSQLRERAVGSERGLASHIERMRAPMTRAADAVSGFA
jgi:hypothetical protein